MIQTFPRRQTSAVLAEEGDIFSFTFITLHSLQRAHDFYLVSLAPSVSSSTSLSGGHDNRHLLLLSFPSYFSSCHKFSQYLFVIYVAAPCSGLTSPCVNSINYQRLCVPVCLSGPPLPPSFIPSLPVSLCGLYFCFCLFLVNR